MTSAALLRELARNCRVFARAATEGRAREELLRIAEEYDRQASAIDLRFGLDRSAPVALAGGDL